MDLQVFKEAVSIKMKGTKQHDLQTNKSHVPCGTGFSRYRDDYIIGTPGDFRLNFWVNPASHFEYCYAFRFFLSLNAGWLVVRIDEVILWISERVVTKVKEIQPR